MHRNKPLITVFHGSALGDIIIAGGLLQQVRDAFVSCTIKLYASHPGRELLLNANLVDAAYPLPTGDCDLMMAALDGPDYVLDMLLPDHQPLSAALDAMHPPHYAHIHPWSLPLPLYGSHNIANRLSLAYLNTGWPFAERRPIDLRVAVEAPFEIGSIRELLTPTVVLAPGASSLHKCWPYRYWLHLSDNLHACHVAWCVGPSDLEREFMNALGTKERVDGRGDSLYLQQTPYAQALCLHGAACFVGNDSGMTHLASALNIPTVAIFGATDPRTWAPTGIGPVTIITPRHRKGIRSVWWTDVRDAITKILLAPPLGERVFQKQGPTPKPTQSTAPPVPDNHQPFPGYSLSIAAEPSNQPPLSN